MKKTWREITKKGMQTETGARVRKKKWEREEGKSQIKCLQFPHESNRWLDFHQVHTELEALLFFTDMICLMWVTDQNRNHGH